jgi:hypothetical protein
MKLCGQILKFQNGVLLSSERLTYAVSQIDLVILGSYMLGASLSAEQGVSSGSGWRNGPSCGG